MKGSLTDIGYIREVMAAHGVAFRKEFGQNFLINPAIPQKIASNVEGNALEIGPGIGCLTRELSLRCDKVLAVEIDTGLIPILADTLSECENVEVINNDIMKCDLPTLISEKFGGEKVSVCANLPYNITTPVLMKLLEHGIDNPPFEKIVVMVQKEVAERLVAPAGSPLYGAVTASASYYAKITKLFNVVSGNFMPRPKVDSAVICLEPYKKAPVDILSHPLFFKTIRGAFAQRRKTLVNSLSTEFSHLSKEQLAGIIERCGFDANIRGEKLSIDDFARLSNELFILGEKSN